MMLKTEAETNTAGRPRSQGMSTKFIPNTDVRNDRGAKTKTSFESTLTSSAWSIAFCDSRSCAPLRMMSVPSLHRADRLSARSRRHLKASSSSACKDSAVSFALLPSPPKLGFLVTGAPPPFGAPRPLCSPCWTGGCKVVALLLGLRLRPVWGCWCGGATNHILRGR